MQKAQVTQAWLAANVGEPSNKWGSKYSEIYKLAGVVEKLIKEEGAKKKEKIEDLYKLINAWSTSAHSGARAADAVSEKNRQERQMNLFRAALQGAYFERGQAFQEDLMIRLSKADATYAKELGLVRGVIAKMTQSANPLIRNTGVGLESVKIALVLRDGENGCWISGREVMNVNPCLAYNHSQLTGLLVHEYHHKLNNAPLEYLYLDEFVAHMKQFSITHPGKSEQAMVDDVNERLRTLYPAHVRRWTAPKSVNDSGSMGRQLVARFADLGDFLIADNGRDRVMGAVRHGCPPRLP